MIIVIVKLRTAEGGHLDQCATHANVCKPESPADQAGTREYRFNFFGYGIGRHLVIFGNLAHQKVAHAPPHDIGFIALFLQPANNLRCMRAKLLNRDTMFSEWDNNVFSDGEFPKLLINLSVPACFMVEPDDSGSLT